MLAMKFHERSVFSTHSEATPPCFLRSEEVQQEGVQVPGLRQHEMSGVVGGLAI